MTLRTGVEMISLSMLFNRMAGLYGLLAVLTGFTFDATQLSMYLYSVTALILLAFLIPHIRKQSPLECLALAWFYTFDAVINCSFTAVFAVTWFVTVSASNSETPGNIPINALGGDTVNDTADFTSPTYNISKISVVASPAADIIGGQDAVSIGKAIADTSITASTNLRHGVGLVESIPSLVIIVVLTIIRVYFVFIVMAYAREVLRQYPQTTPSARGHLDDDRLSNSETGNPFGSNMPLGHGWRGKLGRIMVFIGKRYFFDGPVDDAWAKEVNSRFKNSAITEPNEWHGTFERERRARSGTGPPQPHPSLMKLTT